MNETVNKNIGHATAYGYAKSKGYTGTEEQFAELMASYADVGQTAVDAALAAKASEDAAKASETASAASQTAAATSAGTASTAAQTASQGATTATAKANEAAQSATTAGTAASTATTKATEAAQSATAAAGSATTAGASATAAQTAQTAAETAQGKAEDAQAAAEAAAQTLVIDPTLTQPNQAAEAKATGDAISLVKSHLEAFPDDGTAANAKQLLTDKGITESVPYLFRKSGGDGADREFDTVVGGTVAWNQLANMSMIPTPRDGLEFTGDGTSCTINGTATRGTSITGWFGLSESGAFKAEHVGHVMLLTSKNIGGTSSATPTIQLPSVLMAVGGNGIMGDSRVLKPTTSNSNARVSVTVGNAVVLTNYVFAFHCFDLTQMFGSTVADYIYSLEQATAGAGVAFFRSLFPADYYPYDSGSLKSVEGVSAHQTIGFNLFDKSASVSGAITADGSIGANANRTVSDWIKALPNTNYYVMGIISASDGRGIALYDSGKGYIKTVSPAGASTLTSGTFTTTADTAYIRIGMLNASVNDACLNFSDPAKNGQYEPYNGHTYALDDSLTLRGIPKLTDGKLSFDGDTYAADGTVTRRYGVYTFTGSENWLASSTANRYSVTLASGVLPNCKSPATTTDALQNIISSKYGRFVYKNEDKGAYGYITSNAGLIVVVNDSSIATAAAMKEAMANTALVYELATPTTEEAEPFQSPQICSPYGTEEYITTGIVPVGHSTFYPENLRAKIEELPSNFSTLIAPTESTFTATRNYTTGALFIVQNVLYKATANIANGGTITPGTNCTATTLAEIISALA